MSPRPSILPILPPSGDDAELYAAWKLADQKWQREVEAITAYCYDPCERTRKAMDHAEILTAEAVTLLFDAHRDAERRKALRQPAA